MLFYKILVPVINTILDFASGRTKEAVIIGIPLSNVSIRIEFRKYVTESIGYETYLTIKARI